MLSLGEPRTLVLWKEIKSGVSKTQVLGNYPLSLVHPLLVVL